MRKRSPAKSAASSPPVPARNSRIALFWSAESFGKKLHFELKLELDDLRLDRAGSSFGERHHFRVGSRIVNELLQLVALAHRPAERGYGGDDGIELGELAREPHIALLIRARGERALHRLPTGNELVELIGRDRRHHSSGGPRAGRFRPTASPCRLGDSITGRAAAALLAGGRSSSARIVGIDYAGCRRVSTGPAHRHVRAQAPRPHLRECRR